MRVLLFHRQFWPLIISGAKRQTIRRTARCEPGDQLSLRGWSGTPYHSTHVILGGAVCTEVIPVSIGHGEYQDGLRVGDEVLDLERQDWVVDRRLVFAKADGFRCMSDMLAWFRQCGSPRATENENPSPRLPFEGFAIRWAEISVPEEEAETVCEEVAGCR